MKILRTVVVLGDIHGNVDALKAVLRDMIQHKPDTIVVMGDHLSGPLAVADTANILMDLSAVLIRGNHDRYLVETPYNRLGKTDRCAYDQLSPKHLRWLSSLPPVATLDDEIFLCHGVPFDDETYLLDAVSVNGELVDRPEPEIQRLLFDVDEAVVLCGHSHRAGQRRLSDGRLIVNSGSVGLPAYYDDAPFPHISQSGRPEASYAVLYKSAEGWSAEINWVAYNPLRMKALALEQGFPDWAEALVTGKLSAPRT